MMPPKVDRRPKPKVKKDRLSKRAKKLIIMDIMADRMEDTIRMGFQKSLIAYFAKEKGVKVSHNYMSELVKECREDMELVKRPVFAKEQYVKRYSRLLKKCDKAQDRGTERQTLRDMATLEGHLQDTVNVNVDPASGAEVEDFFRKKTSEGKGKKGTE